MTIKKKLLKILKIYKIYYSNGMGPFATKFFIEKKFGSRFSKVAPS